MAITAQIKSHHKASSTHSVTIMKLTLGPVALFFISPSYFPILPAIITLSFMLLYW